MNLSDGQDLTEDHDHSKQEVIVDDKRRKALLITSGVMGAVTVAGFAVPFLSAWKPSEKAKALGASKVYIKDLKKTLPCAAHLNGEYGVKNVYAGVPVIIGNGGVEKIIEIKLEKNELENFKVSTKAVENLFLDAIKIDKDLSD